MTVYYCTNFTGKFPTGKCAIIVAPSREQAEILLENELSRLGLEQSRHWLPVFTEVPLDQAHANIICDGDY